MTSPDLFQSYRRQMVALRASLGWTMGLTLALSLALIGLVFSMAANERRRELGVLRAVGATRGFVFRSLLAEAGLLALAGALSGIVLTVAVTYLFRRLIVVTLGIPFLMPSPASLAIEVAVGLAVALAVITLAALLPAYRISHLDPAIAMRE